MVAREFATEVVRRLQGAGYEALFAGGCVRDHLLGREPDDFDVATSARPDEIQKLFRRTVAVGAAFGVVEVLGPKPCAVEVASFRSDGPYSDGRHPDSVSYASPREDALRRDFTVNGMFFDPLAGRLIDYVGGERDLNSRVLRAIGDPALRFREDRLRLLRAVRIAARFGLTIESATWSAVVALAGEVTSVSGERIAEELRKLLTLPSRGRAVRLLAESELLSAIAPVEYDTAAVERLDELSSFPSAFAALWGPAGAKRVDQLADRLRLSNAERDRIGWLVAHRQALEKPESLPLHVLKSILAHPGSGELIALHRALGREGAADYCEMKLREWPTEVLNPPPLVTGDDLKALGLDPGPRFKTILDEIRRQQLDGQVREREAALVLAHRLTRV